MSLNDTPRANRLHIGIYGKRNAGKSSLINALTGQDIALVSDEAGTTTDPVFKSMELHPVGPVVFIDTAGFDDEGTLGKLRVERTQAVMEKTDIAVVVVDGAELLEAVEAGFAKGCGLASVMDELPETGSAETGEGNDRLSGKELMGADEPVPETSGVPEKNFAGVSGESDVAYANVGKPEKFADQRKTFGEGSAACSSISKLLEPEKSWIDDLTERHIPVIIVVNKVERIGSEFWQNSSNPAEICKANAVRQIIRKDACGESDVAEVQADTDAPKPVSAAHIAELTTIVSETFDNCPVIPVSALTGAGLDKLRNAIQQSLPEDYLREKILGDIVGDGELVMLVMPQDIQAPKGRLILPQVQTLRELLDRRCTTVATTADGFGKALAVLNKAPDLIITDSQCFDMVYRNKPARSLLTSFSVLFAAYKGDIDKFMAGASALDDITEKSRVLIAEACTHVPLNEDIGRVKIPNLLRKKIGEKIEIVNVCGNDFPSGEELGQFDLVIHCGACMFNRRHVLSRIAAAEAADVPITNYGIIMAKLAGILDKITLPE